jgi:hypothetical protein
MLCYPTWWPTTQQSRGQAQTYNITIQFYKCISEICAVELPRKEWPDIISNLVANTTNDQVEIKKAAMMTLGYICEALVSHLFPIN